MSELAEGARLEIVCAVYSSTEGSNPSLSANTGLICMSYLVLARKYRPQIFDQVVKQDHITHTLANAIQLNRMHHAILFSGPRGTGKTTVARILAKAMNCKNGPLPVPCNTCRSCLDILSGSTVDVFEIDGASNNSVDQVRELRENIKYLPAHSRFKIYIIDEVHMLSKGAFNALLKTLEEPPSHVMFILATTEPHKIPATILSRCQRHDFRRIDIKSIIEHMGNICKKENFDISSENLDVIAREAGGCMRDALSLLDQVMVCASGAVEHKDVIDILGIVDRKIIFDASSALLQNDIAGLLEILSDIYYNGHDLRKFYIDLIEHFRNIFIVKITKQINKLIDLPVHEITLIKEQSKEISSIFINQIFNLLFQEESVVKYSENPKLAIEMVFIKLLQIKPALPVDVFINKLDQLRQGFVYETGEEICQSAQVNKSNKKGTDSPAEPEAHQNVPEEPKAVLSSVGDFNGAWEKVCNVLLKKYPSLRAVLSESSIKELTDSFVKINVNGNKYDLKTINRKKNISAIKKAWLDIFGEKIDIIINAKEILNKSDNSEKERAVFLKEKALKNQLVLDVIEVFNGNVAEVKLV